MVDLDLFVVCRMQQIWFLYFYSSLALRENILRINGSRIHPWWLWHHYVSIAISTLTMTMHDTQLEEYISPNVQRFFVYQGVLIPYESSCYFADRCPGL